MKNFKQKRMDMRHHLIKVMLLVVVFVSFLGNVYASNEAVQPIPKIDIKAVNAQLEEAHALNSRVKEKISCVIKFKDKLKTDSMLLQQSLGKLHEANMQNNFELTGLEKNTNYLRTKSDEQKEKLHSLEGQKNFLHDELNWLAHHRKRLYDVYWIKSLVKKNNEYIGYGNRQIAGQNELDGVNTNIKNYTDERNRNLADLRSKEEPLKLHREKKLQYEKDIYNIEAQIRELKVLLSKSQAFRQELASAQSKLEFELMEFKSIDMDSTQRASVESLHLASDAISGEITKVHMILEGKGVPLHGGKPICPN